MEYKAWCCQKCGAKIGYLGRFVMFVYSPFLWIARSTHHNCPGIFSSTSEKIPKSEGYDWGDNSPIVSCGNKAFEEKNSNARTSKQKYHNPCDTCS